MRSAIARSLFHLALLALLPALGACRVSSSYRLDLRKPAEIKAEVRDLQPLAVIEPVLQIEGLAQADVEELRRRIAASQSEAFGGSGLELKPTSESDQVQIRGILSEGIQSPELLAESIEIGNILQARGLVTGDLALRVPVEVQASWVQEAKRNGDLLSVAIHTATARVSGEWTLRAYDVEREVAVDVCRIPVAFEHKEERKSLATELPRNMEPYIASLTQRCAEGAVDRVSQELEKGLQRWVQGTQKKVRARVYCGWGSVDVLGYADPFTAQRPRPWDLGRRFLEEGKHQLGLDTFLEAERDLGSDPPPVALSRIRHNQALALMELGRYAEAHDRLEGAIALHPNPGTEDLLVVCPLENAPGVSPSVLAPESSVPTPAATSTP